MNTREIKVKKTRALNLGRESFQKQAWSAAFERLSAVDRESPLEPEDLGLLAQAALLIGREAEGMDLLNRVHQAYLTRGEVQFAARYAFWLGFTLLTSGESATASGWLSRANRLLDGQPDCVEKGYLLLPEGYRAFNAGDAKTARAMMAEAAAIGKRFEDKDLTTLGLQGQGRALLRQGEISSGLALLDEAMVAVMAGDVSPLSSGAVYCSVLDACGEICDLQRAQEWTSALEEWCASQPDLVPYRGHCLVRRAELLQLRGAWTDALDWAGRANEWLTRPSAKTIRGEALYQMGEIQRLRGNFAEANEAYQQASECCFVAGPGLAQLRLAQGDVQGSKAAVQQLIGVVQAPGARARVLDAYVEIMLSGNDIAAARTAAEELADIARDKNIPFLKALSNRALGAVLLEEGKAQAALVALRNSWTIWLQLATPYEAARTQVLISSTLRHLGENESARQELAHARQHFASLGAAGDVSRVDRLLEKDTRKPDSPLSTRELQIVKLVASGITNRAIADKLNISEKTVARHLSNIFTKLDLTSRTAATAYAYDHDLI
jgi:DNA-binding CsgD family transcriptional regulator/tetratricopeptide (TPR) repeat protein